MSLAEIKVQQSFAEIGSSIERGDDSISEYKHLWQLHKQLRALKWKCETKILALERNVSQSFDRKVQEFVSANPDLILYSIELPPNNIMPFYDFRFDDDNNGDRKSHYWRAVLWRTRQDAELRLSEFDPQDLRSLDFSRGLEQYIKPIKVSECSESDLTDLLRREANSSFGEFMDPKDKTLIELLKHASCL